MRFGTHSHAALKNDALVIEVMVEGQKIIIRDMARGYDPDIAFLEERETGFIAGRFGGMDDLECGR